MESSIFSAKEKDDFLRQVYESEGTHQVFLNDDNKNTQLAQLTQKAGLVVLKTIDEDFCTVELTEFGKAIRKKGGYTFVEKNSKREKRNRLLRKIWKIAGIIVSAFFAICEFKGCSK